MNKVMKSDRQADMWSQRDSACLWLAGSGKTRWKNLFRLFLKSAELLIL